MILQSRNAHDDPATEIVAGCFAETGDPAEEDIYKVGGRAHSPKPAASTSSGWLGPIERIGPVFHGAVGELGRQSVTRLARDVMDLAGYGSPTRPT